jgi:hypothetical protein
VFELIIVAFIFVCFSAAPSIKKWKSSVSKMTMDSMTGIRFLLCHPHNHVLLKVKRPKHKAAHSHLYSIEFRHAQVYISAVSLLIHGLVLRSKEETSSFIYLYKTSVLFYKAVALSNVASSQEKNTKEVFVYIYAYVFQVFFSLQVFRPNNLCISYLSSAHILYNTLKNKA